MKLVYPKAKRPSIKRISGKRQAKTDKKPTWVSLVFDTLVHADDFMSVHMLMVSTKANIGQATAALHHLAKCKAVESVVGGDRNLWWFATPGCDCRQRILEERTPEEPGTRCRRKSTGKTHSNKG